MFHLTLDILNNKDKTIFGKSYDLSTFMNEEETIKQLEDFTAFCKEKGITIKKES